MFIYWSLSQLNNMHWRSILINSSAFCSSGKVGKEGENADISSFCVSQQFKKGLLQYTWLLTNYSRTCHMACQVLLNLWTGLLLLLYKVCNKSWQTYHAARRTLDQMCLEFKSAKLPFSIYKSPLIFSTNFSNYSQSNVLPTLGRQIDGNVMRGLSCQARSSLAKTTFLVL